MKITTRGQFQTVADFRSEFVSKFLYAHIVKSVSVARMRRRDNMRNSIRNRGFCHRQRNLDAVRAVIDPRQNMTVHIDHGLRILPSATRRKRPAKCRAQTSYRQKLFASLWDGAA